MMKDTNSNTSRVLFVGTIYFFSNWKTGLLRQLFYEISSMYSTICIVQ